MSSLVDPFDAQYHLEQRGKEPTKKAPEVAERRNAGVKLDAGKAPFVQGCLHYFPKALEAVAFVSRYGKEKYKVEYNDVNWKRVPDGLARYTDALGRHISYEAVEGFYDQESHLLHAAHAAWNALARLELLLKDRKLDDRGNKS
jgi:hypothetical protein